MFECTYRCGREITALDEHVCAYLDLFVVCRSRNLSTRGDNMCPASGAQAPLHWKPLAFFCPGAPEIILLNEEPEKCYQLPLTANKL